MFCVHVHLTVANGAQILTLTLAEQTNKMMRRFEARLRPMKDDL